MTESFLNLPEPYEPWNPCTHLGGHEYGVKIARNGHSQVFMFCTDCQCARWGPIAYDSLPPHVDRDGLPVYVDYRKPGVRCEKCGSKDGVEYHHWAPYHLFPDTANEWPGSNLCRGCHRYWHSIVTPDMHRRKAS